MPRVQTALVYLTVAAATACGPILGSPHHEQKQPSAGNGDIPADPEGSAPATVKNTLKPVFAVEPTPGNASRIRLYLSGLVDEETKAPVVFKPNETVFVTEDGQLKGIKVSQGDQTNNMPYDIVFVVDNSGSMSEEADTVTDRILAFADILAKSGLDARLGVVGFDGNLSGALDLGTADDLKTYLTRVSEYYSGDPAAATDADRRQGTDRTRGFDGPAKDKLSTEASTLNDVAPDDENGVVGIRFAQALFSFRPNAQRVFINFTDEAVQESDAATVAARKDWHGYKDFHAKAFCDAWKPTDGIVHSVWSGSLQDGKPYDYDLGQDRESPFVLAECSGGTRMTVASDAKDLDLTKLDVTTALTSSALVEFVTAAPGAKHSLQVTVKNGENADGALVMDVEYR